MTFPSPNGSLYKQFFLLNILLCLGSQVLGTSNNFSSHCCPLCGMSKSKPYRVFGPKLTGLCVKYGAFIVSSLKEIGGSWALNHLNSQALVFVCTWLFLWHFFIENNGNILNLSFLMGQLVQNHYANRSCAYLIFMYVYNDFSALLQQLLKRTKFIILNKKRECAYIFEYICKI